MAKQRAAPRPKKAPAAPKQPRQGAARPSRRRQPKAPTPRVPPVVMDMPWLRRATADVRVSYVCPMCRTRREVTPEGARRFTSLKHVPLDELACSPGCREQWWQALIEAILRTGQQAVLRDMDWVWELQQGVVAERLAEVLQEATAGGRTERGWQWPRRN